MFRHNLISAQNLYVQVFLLQSVHRTALSCPKHIFDQVAQAMLTNSS